MTALQYIEDQGGAVKDWKSDAALPKSLGHVWYLATKGVPTHVFCPDLAVDVKAKVKIGNVAATAGVLQDPIKAGSLVQLPGGILTKALGFMLNLTKQPTSLQVVVGWPSKEELAEADVIEGFNNVISHGIKPVQELGNGDIGLLVAVSSPPAPFPPCESLLRLVTVMQDYPCVVNKSLPIVSLDEDAPEVKTWLNKSVLGNSVHQQLQVAISQFDMMSDGVCEGVKKSLWDLGRADNGNNHWVLGHDRSQKVLINQPSTGTKKLHLYTLAEYFGVEALRDDKPGMPTKDFSNFVLPASMNRYLFFEHNPSGWDTSPAGMHLSDRSCHELSLTCKVFAPQVSTG